MPDNENTSCGFVSVIGMPNAGKSTLINQLVGQKISIVSPKKQTTRCRVLGIMIHEQKDQMIFIDTPGVFDAKKTMEHAMVDAAFSALDEGDCILHLVSANEPNVIEKAAIIERRLPENKPVFLAINKVDVIEKEKLLSLTKTLNDNFPYKATFMISALKNKGIDPMLKHLAEEMPKGIWHYEEDEVTTMPMRMLAAEITREKIFNQLYRELPYAALVETEDWEQFDNGDIKITQAVFIQRDSQKAIVLGKGGSRIKKIGQAARIELEEMMGCKVHLKLFVKVKENWPDNPENFSLMGL
ncbi:MAG: GTPase Era [Bdellovibrionales bacterium]